jgi:hypothetical protein
MGTLSRRPLLSLAPVTRTVAPQAGLIKDKLELLSLG